MSGVQRLRAGLAGAGLGAVAILVDVLGIPGALTGAALIAAGTLLTLEHRSATGLGGLRWWPGLAAGAALALAGAPLMFAAEGFGGLVAGVGGVAALIAAGIGLPDPS